MRDPYPLAARQYALQLLILLRRKRHLFWIKAEKSITYILILNDVGNV
jgi:hypothetical protein